MVQVEVLFFEGCPSHEGTVALVRETIERLGLDACVTEIDVKSAEEAERREFLGSPSVRVDGQDVEPDAAASGSFGRRCRVYATPEGLSGVPPAEMIEAALCGELYQQAGSRGIERTGSCCGEVQSSVQLLIADWCPQCPAAKTFWAELRDQEGFDLEIIDIESAGGSELANELGIRAVPATIIDGVVEFRGTPVPRREDALEKIRSSGSS